MRKCFPVTGSGVNVMYISADERSYFINIMWLYYCLKKGVFFPFSCRRFALKLLKKTCSFFLLFFPTRMSSTSMKMCRRCCWTSSTLDISTRGTRAAWSKSFSLEKPDILLYLAPLLMVTGGNVTT